MLTYRLTQWTTAREMALRGYATSIIAAETGLSQRQCKHLCHMLAREGYRIRQKPRLRSGLMLIRNRMEKVQASLFMLAYCYLGGPAVYQTIQLTALQRAHQCYLEIRSSMPMHHWTDFDINDGWSMARELLKKEAFIIYCRSCSSSYFTSVHQYTNVNCPFCVKKSERAKLSNKKAYK